MELTIDQALRKAIEFHEAGKVQEADRLYTAILKAQPKHSDANHNIGVLAVGVGKVKEALPFFKRAIEANPDTAKFWLSYIDALIKLERLTDATALFRKARKKGFQGKSFNMLEQRLIPSINLSLDAISDAQQKRPNILMNLKLDQAINLAKKKVKAGSLEDATRIYNDILIKYPGNKRAIDGLESSTNHLIGKCDHLQDPTQDQLKALIDLHAQGQLYQVLARVVNLLSHFPKSVALYNIQGTTYRGLGRLEESIEAYNKALSINPAFAEVYYNKGNALQAQGKLEEALEAYDKTIAINPDYADAYYNMGNALNEQGKREKAIAAYGQALAIKPDYAAASSNMGNILQQQGKLEEAIEAYDKTIAINPDYTNAYTNRGNALKEQGNLEEAIESYNKALSIQTDNADAYTNMGNAFNHLGKFKEAIDAYNKALLFKPDNAKAYHNMGTTLKEQGKLEEAIDAYKKALSLEPDYVDAYTNMGNVFQEQGKLEKAIECYDKALSLNPNDVAAQMGLNVVQKLAVPTWHLEMMNDCYRNEAYLKAIQLAISKDDFVLEIGTGSGLLAMMIARSGSKKIITCESSQVISEVAKKIISGNNFDGRIRVINKKSTELKIGKDLPRKADVVISEVLSAEFVGEGVQATILDANKRLLKKNGKMLPESGDIRIALLGDSPELNTNISVGTVCGFDLSKFNSILGKKFSIKFKNKPMLLSDTEIAFKFRLSGSQQLITEQKILYLTAQESGMCLGVIQWLGIQIFKDIKYENKPGEIISHWPTPVYIFRSPIEVTAGEVIKIRASLFKDSVWFDHMY